MGNQGEQSMRYSLNHPDLFLNYCIDFEKIEQETEEITKESLSIFPELPRNYETASADSEGAILSAQPVDQERAGSTGYNLNLSIDLPVHYEIVSVGSEGAIFSAHPVDQERTGSAGYILSIEQLDEMPEPPIIGGQLINFEDAEQENEATMARIHTFEIVDPIFEETYTAHMKKEATGWRGWILDVPEVDCTAQTEKDLLEALIAQLQDALEVEEEEWKKQFGETVKAGKFEPLREEALEDVRAGRFTYL